MKVLVGCEESQVVTKAFRALGHQAYSCDLLPCSGEHPEWHMEMSIENAINIQNWDLLIAHPPCTYLSSSGMHWTVNGKRDQELTEMALDLVAKLLCAPVSRIAVENPIGVISTQLLPPTQIIQPHQFGDDASKATCLWLENLPKLIHTKYIPPRYVDGLPRWSNQDDGGRNNVPVNSERAAIRSKTYPGIAAAMAAQWGRLPKLKK